MNNETKDFYEKLLIEQEKIKNAKKLEELNSDFDDRYIAKHTSSLDILNKLIEGTKCETLFYEILKNENFNHNKDLTNMNVCLSESSDSVRYEIAKRTENSTNLIEIYKNKTNLNIIQKISLNDICPSSLKEEIDNFFEQKEIKRNYFRLKNNILRRYQKDIDRCYITLEIEKVELFLKEKAEYFENDIFDPDFDVDEYVNIVRNLKYIEQKREKNKKIIESKKHFRCFYDLLKSKSNNNLNYKFKTIHEECDIEVNYLQHQSDEHDAVIEISLDDIYYFQRRIRWSESKVKMNSNYNEENSIGFFLNYDSELIDNITEIINL